jgi:hypothetical protein
MASPDLIAVARSFGLTNATYPTPEAFAHWGVKHTLGWELIKKHDVRTIGLSDRKVVIPCTEVARVLYEREHSGEARRPRGKNRHVAASNE